MVHFNKQIRNLKENFFWKWPSDSQRKNYILALIFADLKRVSRQKDQVVGIYERKQESKKTKKHAFN